MAKPRDTQVDRLQAGLIAQYEAGVRFGECNGALAAVRRMISDRGLLAELPGRAVVADLVRRFGAAYVRSHLETHGLLELAPALVQVTETGRGCGKTARAAELQRARYGVPDANSPEGVGAKGEPGGWTGGLTTFADPGDDDGP